MYLIERIGKKVHVVNRRTREVVSAHDNMGDAKEAMRKAFAKLDDRKTKRQRVIDTAEEATGGDVTSSTE